MAVLWLACAGFFQLAAQRGVVAPTLDVAAARGAALPPAYPAFSPLAFSLEHALPFVDLQQRRLWGVAADPAAPWAMAARLVAGSEVTLGWVLCLLGVACAITPLNRAVRS
jgi:hypothetical protein